MYLRGEAWRGFRERRAWKSERTDRLKKSKKKGQEVRKEKGTSFRLHPQS